MLEVTPKRAFNLDSPVNSLVKSDAIYAVTSRGSVYCYEAGAVKEVLKVSGVPRYVLPGLGGIIAAFHSDSASQVYAIVKHSHRTVFSLPKLDGVAASSKLVAAWYGDPKKFLRTFLLVARPDSRVIIKETPRIVAACALGESLYMLTIDGRLQKLTFEGGALEEEWRTSLGAACDWLLPTRHALFVRCEGSIHSVGADDGRLLHSFKTLYRRGVALGDKLVMWDVERPSIVTIDAETKKVKEVELEPVFLAYPAENEKLYVIMRWKIAIVDTEGEVEDAFYMPVPLVEHFAVGPPMLFSVREWLIESEPETPLVQVRKIQVDTVERLPVLRLELSVLRPGSLEPVDDVKVTVRVGEGVERATVKGGLGRATLTTGVGHQRLTIITGGTIKVGKFSVEKTSEVSREFEIPAVEPAHHAVGDVLGRRIVLQEKLGAGGFGVVYKGRDMVTDRLVAVKIPHNYFAPEEAQSQMVTEALKSAEVSRRLNREKKTVVEVYEAGVYELEDLSRTSKGKTLAIVMEYCEGGSLRSLLEAGTLRKPTDIALKIAEKVHRLNSEGIVHGDLKPENILFTAQGEPLLSDFYTVTMLDKFERLKRYRELALTEGYAPPELIEFGEVNPRTDVYSYATLVIEMLTGSIPKPGSVPTKLFQVSGLKPKFLRYLSDAISPNPRLRPSMDELMKSLTD